MDELIQHIRKGDIDINNQELFFSILLKGFLTNLNKDICIRNQSVPHYILNTGNDALFIENKGQDISIEPYEVSNEDYFYNKVPCCIVTPGALNVLSDQVTNPYTIGQLYFSTTDNMICLKGEMRRIPIRLEAELTYYVNSYKDILELTQQIISKLLFIKTYQISYMGQIILCSYRIPDTLTGEYMTELNGQTLDNRYRKLQISLEVDSNIPIYSPCTMMYADDIITDYLYNYNIKN